MFKIRFLYERSALY